MIKKLLILVTLLALAFSAAGCGAQSIMGDMQIGPAQLTDQESGIAKLLQNNSSAIFDYTANSEVDSFTVTCYQLDKSNSWVPVHSMDLNAANSISGRIAISFDNLGDGFRVALQDGEEMSASEDFSNPKIDTTNMSKASSLSASTAEIEYEKEIPLAMQIITSKSDANPCGADNYFTPEVYKDKDYEFVYAVTIKFSNNEIQ